MKYLAICAATLLAIALGGCDMEEEEVPQMDMENHQMPEPNADEGPTVDDGVNNDGVNNGESSETTTPDQTY